MYLVDFLQFNLFLIEILVCWWRMHLIQKIILPISCDNQDTTAKLNVLIMFCSSVSYYLIALSWRPLVVWKGGGHSTKWLYEEVDHGTIPYHKNALLLFVSTSCYVLLFSRYHSVHVAMWGVGPAPRTKTYHTVSGVQYRTIRPVCIVQSLYQRCTNPFLSKVELGEWHV